MRIVLLLIVLITATASYATQISPQIAPAPSARLIIAVTDERCSNSSATVCHDEIAKLTACLNASSSAASKDSYLLVQNDGEVPLQVKITIPDISTTFPEISVSQNQAKKIKILVNIEGSPSIILNAGNGTCIIPTGSAGRYSQFYNQYITHLSPIYGTYFLFFTLLIAGGAWACCKIGKNEHHADRIRYQELEMGQPELVPNAIQDEETGEGWNEDWDDEWGEQEEVTSLQTENVSSNGHNFKTSDTNGWGNDWDD